MKRLFACMALLFAPVLCPTVLAQDTDAGGVTAAHPEEHPRFGDRTKADMTVMYSGEDAPDGLIFQSLVRRMASGIQDDPERAQRDVKRGMGIESDDEALAFIGRLANEHKKLEKAHAEARRTFICGARPGRSRSELFNDLESLARVRVTIAADAYDRFLTSLSPDEAADLDRWIQFRKPGFAYYAPSAEQMTDRMGVDAIAHYKDKCIRIEQKLEGLK